MGRPKGSKNRNPRSEELPKTRRQSTSIATTSSSSSSCTSAATTTITGSDTHDEQIVVPSVEGIRGKPLRGRGSRGGRGRNSNNNNITPAVIIPSTISNRGRGRGKGRGNSISASTFLPTIEQQQQPALNFPIQLPLPRSRVQNKHDKLKINSNPLPPVTEIISRTRTTQLINYNEEDDNSDEIQMEYRVPITAALTIPSSSTTGVDNNNTFTLPMFGSQNVRGGGSNNNNVNNRGRGRGRGVRGVAKGRARGGTSRRGSKKMGESPILLQQLSPAMNLTTTTTTLPSYEMAVCSTTSTIPFSVPSSLTSIPPPPYERTSLVQLNSIPMTSQMLTQHERNMIKTQDFNLPWGVNPSSIPEKTFQALKKDDVTVPRVTPNNSEQTPNINDGMKQELIKQRMVSPTTTTTILSQQPHPYDASFPANQHNPPQLQEQQFQQQEQQQFQQQEQQQFQQQEQQQFQQQEQQQFQQQEQQQFQFQQQQEQQFQQQQQSSQQNLPLPRTGDGDVNLNYYANQSMQFSNFTSTINKNVVSSNNTYNLNLSFNDDVSKTDDIKNQTAGNMVIYQPPPPPPPQQQQQIHIQGYPALSQQQMDNINMGVKRNIVNEQEQQLQQLNSGYQVHQQPPILYQSNPQQQLQQQHFNDYSCSQNQQNNYISTQHTSLYEKQMGIDEQGNGQNTTTTSITFTPFTSSLEIPVIITTTNSSTTTTCDIPSATAVTQTNPYVSNMTSNFQQKQQQFFPNYAGHTMSGQNTISHDENVSSNSGQPPTSIYMENVKTPLSNFPSFHCLKGEQAPDVKLKEEENYLGSNNEQVEYSTSNSSSTNNNQKKKNDLSASSPCPNYFSDSVSRNNASSSLVNENNIHYNRRIQSSSSSSSTTMFIQESIDSSGIDGPIYLPKTIHHVEGVVISHSSHEDSDTLTDSSLENNESRDGTQNVDCDIEIGHDEIASTIEIGQEDDISTPLDTVIQDNSYSVESEHENISTNKIEVENTEEKEETTDAGNEVQQEHSSPSAPPFISRKNIKVKVKGSNKKNRQQQEKVNFASSTINKQDYDDTEIETKNTQQQKVESTKLMNVEQPEKQGRDSIGMEISQQSMDVNKEEEPVSFGQTVEDSQEYSNSTTTRTISKITPNFNDAQQTVLMSEEERKPNVETEGRADLSQTAETDESKKVSADQQTGASQNDPLKTEYRVNKKGIVTNVNRPQPGSGKCRWMYNSEHKAFLFQDGKFVIERQDTFTTEDIFVWRIIKKGVGGRPCLRKFVPIQIDGRECHTGVDTFVPIRFNDHFFNNYQPVIFRMLSDKDNLQIGMLYRIDRSLPLLGYLPTTEHLFPDFKLFLLELTKMAIRGQYKDETSCEPFEKGADNPTTRIENYMKKMIDAIIAEPKWPADILVCVLTYPKFSTSKSGVVKSAGCQACGSVNKKGIGAYKLLFAGSSYDHCTLQLHDKNDKDPVPPDYQFCHACPGTLRTLHRMMHYKWWTCANIRAQIMELCNQLKENEQFRAGDILEYFMGDFEWVEKMFLDFQILAIEGAHAINKAQKQEKFQKKRNSLLPPKASQADQEQEKNTFPVKTTQQPVQEKQEPVLKVPKVPKVPKSTKKGKLGDGLLLPPVPSLDTLKKVLNTHQRKSRIKRRQQGLEFPVVVKSKRKSQVPKLDIQSQMSEEQQLSPAGNSRPRRKNSKSLTTTRRKSLNLPPPQYIPDDVLQKMVKHIENRESTGESPMNETKVQEIQTESSQEIEKGEEEQEDKDHTDITDDPENANN